MLVTIFQLCPRHLYLYMIAFVTSASVYFHQALLSQSHLLCYSSASEYVSLLCQVYTHLAVRIELSPTDSQFVRTGGGPDLIHQERPTWNHHINLSSAFASTGFLQKKSITISDTEQTEPHISLPGIFSSIVDELANVFVPLAIHNIHNTLYCVLCAPCTKLCLIMGAEVADSEARIICKDLHSVLLCSFWLAVGLITIHLLNTQAIFNVQAGGDHVERNFGSAIWHCLYSIHWRLWKQATTERPSAG
jgi:hypothetical protein